MLFSLKNYIIKKIINSNNTYINLFENKHVAIEKIKKSSTSSDIREALCFAIRQNIYSASNFFILIDFYVYLIEQQTSSIQLIEEETILDFLFIYGSNKSIYTQNRFKNTVLSFSNYYRTKLCNLKPINIASNKKCPKKLFFNEFLSIKEVKKIFEFIDNNYVNEVDIAILKLLIRTGIRVSELINIKKEDIFTNDPCFYIISIKGKNNLYRNAYIQKKHIKKEFTALLKISNKWIFEKKGKKVTSQNVYYLVSKTLKKNNINKNKNGPHLLRHTFATHLYRKTKDIILVQESLGHKSIQSTQLYIHTDFEYIKKMCSAYDE